MFILFYFIFVSLDYQHFSPLKSHGPLNYKDLVGQFI